ncbi:hypothetical protein GCM10009802_06590 [Streptomyces synnematoformans]|uniref:Uncharacterized protein n=1 Tax=Streptomyces synnematoformans TaxID=415721 RepID=A0ABN2XGX8_9ACTN
MTEGAHRAAATAPGAPLPVSRPADRCRTGRCCKVSARGIVPAIARRGARHGTGPGAYRWVVERTPAWLHGF